jgi:glycosyltransferase involved in cell wall biosynthesis
VTPPAPDPRPARVVLVHDYLLVLRGAERTFAAMTDVWPDAPIATLLHDEAGTQDRFAGREVRTSGLQRLGVSQRGFRALLPLFPFAAERLPVADADLVVSSSSAFAHGVRPREGAVHVCYCHTPFRYAWFEERRALEEAPAPLRPALRAALRRHRRWDLAASRRVTAYVANGEITRRRIADVFGREAAVVHPPVDVERFRPEPGAVGDELLVVSELVRHKRVDVAVEAARRAGRRIAVVGTGPDEARLRALHGDGVRFLGRVDDASLARLYARAAALVVPNVEEFGIAAVEAQAAGRPVVAPAAGGTAETVVDGATGVLVPPGDADALAEALRETDFGRFDGARIAAHAQRFSAAAFRERLAAEVERVRADQAR